MTSVAVTPCPACGSEPKFRSWPQETFPRRQRQYGAYGCRQHGHWISAKAWESPNQVALTDHSLREGAAGNWEALVAQIKGNVS